MVEAGRGSEGVGEIGASRRTRTRRDAKSELRLGECETETETDDADCRASARKKKRQFALRTGRSSVFCFFFNVIAIRKGKKRRKKKEREREKKTKKEERSRGIDLERKVAEYARCTRVFGFRLLIPSSVVRRVASFVSRLESRFGAPRRGRGALATVTQPSAIRRPTALRPPPFALCSSHFSLRTHPTRTLATTSIRAASSSVASHRIIELRVLPATHYPLSTV